MQSAVKIGLEQGVNLTCHAIRLVKDAPLRAQRPPPHWESKLQQESPELQHRRGGHVTVARVEKQFDLSMNVGAGSARSFTFALPELDDLPLDAFVALPTVSSA